MSVLPYVVLLGISVGILALLLIPISFRLDSSQRSLTVGWMGLSVTRRLGRKKARRPEEKPEKKKRRTIKAIGRLLLKDKYLILELLQKLYRPLLCMLRSASIREIEAKFSTPDPLWNGVLYGIIANIHHKNVKLSVNFQNINYLRGCFQIYPYRVVNAVTGLLIRLPYRRISRAVLSVKKQE